MSHTNKYRLLIAALSFVLSAATAMSQTAADTLPADSVQVTSKGNIFQRIIRYFDDSNNDHPEKPLDFSFIGGPYYSSETKLSIGLVGSALYKSRTLDSLTTQSNANLLLKVGITGFYEIALRGSHYGPRDRYRINYEAGYESLPTYFWGIGFDNAYNNDNRTKYKQLNPRIRASLEFQPIKNFFVGPAINFNYVNAKNAADYTLWDGQSRHIASTGIGFNISYDTRDITWNASRGWAVNFEQRFYPSFLGNRYAFCSSEFRVSNYIPAWRGATIAWEARLMATYGGTTPWSMMASEGGSYRLRGYYNNRYRDRNAADITVELRQHVWRRSGIVVWAGVGNVFPSFSEIDFHHMLPNFGVGYRWEFKNRVNIRLDVGFGRHEKGFIFNVNESF